MKFIQPYVLLFLSFNTLFAVAQAQKAYMEPHRPQIHFSPPANWMNDPNGLLYSNGVYHLFYQYYPKGTKWGPMHWGHATSPNLMHWTHQPIALYPDSLGYIFSGSAVLDKANTSGLGKGGKAPMVAIFTYHDPVGEKEGRKDYQTQGIAYSHDEGKTWTKYSGNPVLNNPDIQDFRDPKVMWYEPEQKWLMTLATKDRISFYSAPDLMDWNKESEFGAEMGAHGGVWECPDLFQLEYKGKKHWVLIVNINPGGPNGGSATQYFIGNFDGKNFIPADTATRWLDYGPDEYAGITYENTGNRKIFLGWMSNWMYAQDVPTHPWRSAATIPRDLRLQEAAGKLFVASTPSPELNVISSKAVLLTNVAAANGVLLSQKWGGLQVPCRIDLRMEQLEQTALTFSNSLGEELIVGYDKEKNSFYIDRSKSGKVDFHKEFAAKHWAPRLATAASSNMTLVVDVASIELFADSGLSVMTEVFFPQKPYTQLHLKSGTINQVKYTPLKRIWK